ncbi:hypothetical protein BOTBODRAFT_219099 [Botryobasidium botryosum FD-172 SS1]|uniref:Uncharacterized protein n=1 Tax=Botryobasidium botryosum (strain FD-172 SS1) TaxID=930990 RepID=A0A067MMC5_BOTB1|nr:hypothetical protein BOTBODRAFT_219099 [Botryobasidium botryosum FD-172 SS1]
MVGLTRGCRVMSMHVESVTSPARLRAPEGNRDLSSICKHLNWRGDTRVAGISGAMPLEGEWDTAIKSFSEVIDVPTRNTPFAQQAVFRGVPEERAAAWLEKGSMREPYLTKYVVISHSAFSVTKRVYSTYVPPAPIPSSFPFFRPAPSVPTYSSLTTGPGLLPLVENYARVVDYAIKRGWEFGEGVQRDELKEAKEGLWGVWGAYGGGEDGAEEERGEDE